MCSMASSIMIQSGETARLADTRLTARPPVDDMILFNFVFFGLFFVAALGQPVCPFFCAPMNGRWTEEGVVGHTPPVVTTCCQRQRMQSHHRERGGRPL